MANELVREYHCPVAAGAKVKATVKVAFTLLGATQSGEFRAVFDFDLDLSRPPMVRYLLIVQVPNASHERGVTLTFRPIDRFPLCFESSEHVVRIAFDHIIVYLTSLRAALRARFDVHIRHDLLSLDSLFFVNEKHTRNKPPWPPQW